MSTSARHRIQRRIRLVRLALLPILGCVVMYGAAQAAADSPAYTPTHLPKPLAQGSPAQVINAHECWSGPAPADMTGKIPGHVVVTRSGSDRAEFLGPVMVGQALDQIFGGKPHGLKVHAFCR